MALRKLLLLLTLLTLAGLLANAFWMTRVLRIDGSGPQQALTVVDDRESGGLSQASLHRGEKGPLMRCRLSLAHAWPYCDLQVLFGPQGLDMERFDTLKLWLRARGPNTSLRIFLRNSDAAHAGTGKASDLKPHELVLDPTQEALPVELPLRRFMVASWWLQEHKLALRDTGPQLNRVLFMSLTTGGGAPAGDYEIELERAELQGQWVAPATFRLGLILLWMGSLLAYLVWEWRLTRRQLKHSQQHKHMLQMAHAALQLKSSDLAQQALHDPLTGVLNRAGLEQQIAALQAMPEASAYPLALVFVDVDHFKRINDGHGHEVGDAVLRQFAQLLRGNLQRVDHVARWGGEEFLLLLPQTEAAEAAAVAERLRACMHAAPWPEGLQVRASFGVAACLPAQRLDDTLRAADRAMYRAKMSGRDRVELATP